MIVLLAMLLSAQSAVPPLDFNGALKRADTNEAGLDPSSKATLVQSQDTALHEALARCVNLAPGRLPAFSIVLQLDAAGRSLQSWRDSDVPMVRCVEAELVKVTYPIHHTPDFFTSFVVTFER